MTTAENQNPVAVKPAKVALSKEQRAQNRQVRKAQREEEENKELEERLKKEAEYRATLPSVLFFLMVDAAKLGIEFEVFSDKDSYHMASEPDAASGVQFHFREHDLGYDDKTSLTLASDEWQVNDLRQTFDRVVARKEQDERDRQERDRQKAVAKEALSKLSPDEVAALKAVGMPS